MKSGKVVGYGRMPHDMPHHVRVIAESVEAFGLLRDVLYYVCGHCNVAVTGWVVAYATGERKRQWLLCPRCGGGSVKNDDIILPPRQTFRKVDGLSGSIAALYDEARASFNAQAYTGCEILCRKILMSMAVDEGAKPNRRFVEYVDYLDSNGYITPALKDMATAIKDNGNEAAHEIDQPSQERAEYTLKFTRRILDITYGAEHEFGRYDV